MLCCYYFYFRVNKFPDRPALKVERGDQWLTWTYREYLDSVKTVAKAFIKVMYSSYGFMYCLSKTGLLHLFNGEKKRGNN